MSHKTLWCKTIGLFLVALSSSVQAQVCDVPEAALSPSRDLYCIELIPAPRIEGAFGRVELGRIPGPFTIAVGRDG
ncbi:MAG: hypothetical protein M3497_02015, partial [Gemmatimonadota bacterium]|nr:hypothetical protein [Gemmatimonadota bacterium]